MTATLRRAYRDLEGDARNYVDPDAVFEQLRRRRTRRTGAVVLCVALLVLGSSGVFLASRQPIQTALPQTPGAPMTVKPPGNAPPLPDGATGLGTLVYTACPSGCPTYVVVESGEQYLLGEQTTPPPGNLTLSPDGRWLGQPTAEGYEMRDLLGTARLRIPRPTEGEETFSPWAWSEDSRRLILGYHADGAVSHYVDLALPAGTTAPAPVPPGWEPVGILRSGEVVLLNEQVYDRSPARTVPLRIGATGRGIELRPGAGEEGVFADGDHGLSVQVAGDRIYALAHGRGSAAVLRYSADAEVQGRIPLDDTDSPIGPLDEEFMVMHIDETGTTPAMLVGLTPTTRRQIAEVPAEALVVTRGLARH